MAQAAEAGFRQTRVSTGQGVLDFYEFFMSPGLAIGVLLAFSILFHFLSYFAMANLYRNKR